MPKKICLFKISKETQSNTTVSNISFQKMSRLKILLNIKVFFMNRQVAKPSRHFVTPRFEY